MTNVRPAVAEEGKGKKSAASKMAGRRSTKAAVPTRGAARSTSRRGGAEGRVSRVAQVRLQEDEMVALQKVMRQLHMTSTSEALREGIRLLVREADEIAAAEDIRTFYGEQPAPLPEGVTSATEQELAAVDAEQW